MKYMMVCLAIVLLSGCTRIESRNNAGLLDSFPAPTIEATWIRNGEPILYDNQEWVPVDDIENMADAELYQISEYKGVQIFVDKIDVKPYDRLYTKFSKGKFRYFERQDND